MNASRYVDITGDSPKRTVLVSPSTVSSVGGMLETVSMSAGTVRVSWKLAFIAGSSQQGMARRADDGSNCVVAIVRDVPSARVYSLR